jgi:hypothetical protein
MADLDPDAGYLHVDARTIPRWAAIPIDDHAIVVFDASLNACAAVAYFATYALGAGRLCQYQHADARGDANEC